MKSNPHPSPLSEREREFPFITLILPIRNEAPFITEVLDAVVTQDYPHDQIEILVADGMSDDGTRDVVARYTTHDPRVRLMDNPERIVPTGLNRALATARGEIIIRVDGHAVIASDYVVRCVEILDEKNVWCVGGAIETVGETITAKAIALAQSSPVGVGGAAFRYARDGRYVDTLAFGAYRREVFEKIGTFDEELTRNQDDEFNFRLIRVGKKIWLDPRIRSKYYSRATMRGLWKQYFEYGFYKVRVMQKHKSVPTARALVPGGLVFGLVASVAASALFGSWMPVALVAGSYLGGVIIAALWTYFVRDKQTSPILIALAFLILHIGYGVGFWVGVVRWNLKK